VLLIEALRNHHEARVAAHARERRAEVMRALPALDHRNDLPSLVTYHRNDLPSRVNDLPSRVNDLPSRVRAPTSCTPDEMPLPPCGDNHTPRDDRTPRDNRTPRPHAPEHHVELQQALLCCTADGADATAMIASWLADVAGLCVSIRTVGADGGGAHPRGHDELKAQIECSAVVICVLSAEFVAQMEDCCAPRPSHNAQTAYGERSEARTCLEHAAFWHGLANVMFVELGGHVQLGALGEHVHEHVSWAGVLVKAALAATAHGPWATSSTGASSSRPTLRLPSPLVHRDGTSHQPSTPSSTGTDATAVPVSHAKTAFLEAFGRHLWWNQSVDVRT